MKGDRICIRDLTLECIIGVNPEERVQKQPILIDIVLYTDLSKAGTSDSIDDTISYSDLEKRIANHVEQSSYQLIEKLAEETARICLEQPRTKGVDVCVKKPGALARAAYASVEIYRSK